MDWTPEQTTKLETLIDEAINGDVVRMPYPIYLMLRHLYDRIHMYRETPDEIHQKIKDLVDMETSFDTRLEYHTLYDILYGDYDNLPMYINIPGLNILVKWRLSANT